MAWMIITGIGVWIALSAFILLVICMNSSRLSQTEAPMKRTWQARAGRKRVIPRVQTAPSTTSGD
jgi:hypothetical protein